MKDPGPGGGEDETRRTMLPELFLELNTDGLILALRRGIAPDNPLRPALLTFLGAAAAEIGSAVARFEEGRMRALRDDLHDVLAAAHPH